MKAPKKTMPKAMKMAMKKAKKATVKVMAKKVMKAHTKTASEDKTTKVVQKKKRAKPLQACSLCNRTGVSLLARKWTPSLTTYMCCKCDTGYPSDAEDESAVSSWQIMRGLGSVA